MRCLIYNRNQVTFNLTDPQNCANFGTWHMGVTTVYNNTDETKITYTVISLSSGVTPCEKAARLSLNVYDELTSIVVRSIEKLFD